MLFAAAAPQVTAECLNSRPPSRNTSARSWVSRAEGWSGGHFTALEQPAGFVDDVRATFRLLR